MAVGGSGSGADRRWRSARELLFDRRARPGEQRDIAAPRLTRSPDSDPGWMEKRHGQMTADGVLQ